MGRAQSHTVSSTSPGSEHFAIDSGRDARHERCGSADCGDNSDLPKGLSSALRRHAKNSIIRVSIGSGGFRVAITYSRFYRLPVMSEKGDPRISKGRGGMSRRHAVRRLAACLMLAAAVAPGASAAENEPGTRLP